jgi:hypothetical protein
MELHHLFTEMKPAPNLKNGLLPPFDELWRFVFHFSDLRIGCNRAQKSTKA